MAIKHTHVVICYLWEHDATPSFLCVLEIQTPVLNLAWQALHYWAISPAPSIVMSNISTTSTRHDSTPLQSQHLGQGRSIRNSRSSSRPAWASWGHRVTLLNPCWRCKSPQIHFKVYLLRVPRTHTIISDPNKDCPILHSGQVVIYPDKEERCLYNKTDVFIYRKASCLL